MLQKNKKLRTKRPQKIPPESQDQGRKDELRGFFCNIFTSCSWKKNLMIGISKFWINLESMIEKPKSVLIKVE